MADTKISALTALTGANTASGDLFPIADVSATATKSITRDEARLALGVANTAFISTTTRSTITAQIPLDDTIPQNTEGTELLSTTLTPRTTTSKVRVRAVVPFSGNATLNVIAALFLNSGANAIAGTVFSVNSNGFFHVLVLEYEHVPGSTSAQTYALRVGPGSASSVYINGQATRFLGGVMAATMSIEEILI